MNDVNDDDDDAFDASDEYIPKPWTEIRLETRVYRPKGYVGREARKWVGKKVTVKWLHPIFSRLGVASELRENYLPPLSRHNSPVHILTAWHGFVTELNKSIPAEELVHA